MIFFWRHGYLPDLDAPRLFNEWVQWRKLYDRDLGLAALTDKFYAKAYAAERIGPELIIPTLWQGRRLPDVAPWPLPLIVKSNHGCKQFVVVRCVKDWQRARRLAPSWLKTVYGKWLDEWHYGRAEQSLLVEPFIGPAEGLPTDYKLFVFGGVAPFVQVHVDRHADHRWVQYDRDWSKISHCSADVDRPMRLAEMLDAAEKIAGNRDHLRVDFYEVAGRLWFGETCLFPGSGLDPFDPVELDEIFGRLWTTRVPGDEKTVLQADLLPMSQ
ncbi:MAG: polysaccharide biosynthesis protein [Pseudomonadota bacterium]|nr:polysaccharide biosynthesis protein [Pseudomonadota bacterium]